MTDMYHVNLWGSKPGTNDDCWTGTEVETLEEALQIYNDPWGRFKGFDFSRSSTAYIELVGPNVYKTRQNPEYDDREDDDDDWRREMAREAGMLHGVSAYNEVMGYD